MSQPSTISKPPPSAKPLTRAITGTFERLAQRDAAEAAGPRRGPVFERRLDVAGFFRSAPAQKARSPAPVSTTHADVVALLDVVPDADAARLRSPGRPRSCTSGRSMVTVATWFATRSQTLMRRASALRSARAPARQHLLGVLARACGGARRRPACAPDICDRAGDELQLRARPARRPRGSSRCAASAGRPAPRACRAPARRAGPAPRAAPANAPCVLLAKRSRKIACSSALCANCASRLAKRGSWRQVVDLQRRADVAAADWP